MESPVSHQIKKINAGKQRGEKKKENCKNDHIYNCQDKKRNKNLM